MQQKTQRLKEGEENDDNSQPQAPSANDNNTKAYNTTGREDEGDSDWFRSKFQEKK